MAFNRPKIEIRSHRETWTLMQAVRPHWMYCNRFKMMKNPFQLKITLAMHGAIDAGLPTNFLRHAVRAAEKVTLRIRYPAAFSQWRRNANQIVSAVLPSYANSLIMQRLNCIRLNCEYLICFFFSNFYIIGTKSPFFSTAAILVLEQHQRKLQLPLAGEQITVIPTYVVSASQFYGQLGSYYNALQYSQRQLNYRRSHLESKHYSQLPGIPILFISACMWKIFDLPIWLQKFKLPG